MKLTLKNFRCYKDRTFEFNDGLTLISGPSGIGKSTILMAINFALFGTGLKLSTIGTNTCSVELVMKDIKIIRKKRPNHLIVNDRYEDDAGQSIIDKKFGESFHTTGYIDQNARNSFIMMSPNDKLGFLETFAFRDINLKELKEKCKEHISKTNDVLNDKQTKLTITSNMVSEMIIPEKFELEFLDKFKTEKNQQTTIKNERILSKNTVLKLRKKEEYLEKLQEQYHELELMNVSIQSIVDMNIELEETLNIISEEFNSYSNHQDNIEYYRNMLDYVISNRKRLELETRIKSDIEKLNEMRTSEKTEIMEEIKEIESKLWTDYNSKDEVLETIDNTKNYMKDIKKVERLKEQIKDDKVYNIDELHRNSKDVQDSLKLKNNIINVLKTQKEYICPCCNTKLQLINDELKLHDNITDYRDYDVDELTIEIENLMISKNTLEDDIRIYERNQLLQNEINTILETWDTDDDVTSESLQTDIIYLKQYMNEQISLETKRGKLQSKLDNDQFSQSFMSFNKNIQIMKKELEDIIQQSMNTEMSIDMNEDEIREHLQHEEHTMSKISDLKKNIEEIKHKVDKNNNKISSIKQVYTDKYNDNLTIECLNKKLDKTKQCISEMNEQRKYHEQRLKDIEIWLENKKQIEHYRSWTDKIIVLEQEVIECRKRHSAAVEMKDKIIQAESIAITNVIHTINTHANVYLESFFPDTPISVQLQPFKQTKNQLKPTINITIEYKGMEIDISMLSGGELSRIVLAYTLSLSEIFNTPLLMLDECTASLDQELTNDVFLSIKEHFNERNTIIIAHQVVTGTFDNVIIM